MDKRRTRLSAKLVVNAVCAAIALGIVVFLAAIAIEGKAEDTFELFDRIIVGIIGIVIIAFTLWFIVRGPDRRDDPGR